METQADIDPRVTDTLLSKELMRLSFRDRNNISEEVHGVRSVEVEENSNVRKDGLKKLQYELELLPPSDKAAFEESQTFPVTYVNDPDFRLRFLRAELFDAKKAAMRMACYLNLARELFGTDALKRPLRLTDFKSKEEKSCLRSGLVQLLPYRDRSGRRVMVILSDMMSHNHITRVKIFLYLLTVAAECEESQRKGVIFVMWPGRSTDIRVPETKERCICKQFFSVSPLRAVSFHFCWPDTSFFRFVRSFFVLVMGASTRSRVKFHSGERQELSYKLMGFGIPIQLLPTTESGALKTKNHTQWFKTRQLIEKHASSTLTTEPAKLLGAIECPSLNDVLYERTKPCVYHPGNTRFKGLIEERKEQHALLSQTGKRDFSWSIVEEIEKRNGRFLTWDRKNGFWVQLRDRSEIRLKVATSLRDFNKHCRAVAKVQTTSSVCKVSFDDGQELKKRRIWVSDDESSQPDTKSPIKSPADGCLPSLFDFKAGEEFLKAITRPDGVVSSGSIRPHAHMVSG